MQKVLRELSEVVGLGDTLEIVSRWGGRELYIPKAIERSDALALTLGFATARKLVDAFGGERLQLPIERNALLELRNRAIVREVRAGDSLADVALRYGLTRQAVRRIVDAVPADAVA